MPTNIEEDFRFATKVEVLNYTQAELIRKPHICGFDLSQLLDQIDGQLISSKQAGRKFCGLVQAPGGTALCIAKHLINNECENELLLVVDEGYDYLLLNELRDMGNVAEVTTDSELSQFDNYFVDCHIIACRGYLLEQFQELKRHPRLSWKACIAVDYDKELEYLEINGHYFMNSAVWIYDVNRCLH